MKDSYARKKIYNYLVSYITENGYAPSIREICSGVGLSSTSSVAYHLEELEKLGKIKVKVGTSRAISLTGYKLVKIE